MEHATARSEAGRDEPRTALPLDLAVMRATTDNMLAGDSVSVPRFTDVVETTAELRGHLGVLIAEVRTLAAAYGPDDVPAAVARHALGEAERRMAEAEGVGLMSAYHHARRLARSVRALADHYETLS